MKKNTKLNNFLEQIQKEFNKFFGIKINKIKITYLKNRGEIDKMRKKKTENWVVGWTNKNTVFILNKEKFEEESNHKKKEFFKVLKHEIAHIYLYQFLNFNKPAWIHEGIPTYLAGQAKKIPLKESLKALNYFSKYNKNIYRYSGALVYYLIKKFGKARFLEFLKGIKAKTRNKENFKRYFYDYFLIKHSQ